MPDPNPDRKPGRRQIKANAKVTYHAEAGDVLARIVRFGPGSALLRLDDGSEVLNVREGTDVGCWTSIPPRR